jgi:PAT family beta-lactamase induction signal transducer AmpG
VVEQLVAGIGTSAFVVFILRLCGGAHKATHFAFATAVMSVAGTIAGSLSGFLLEAVGFPWFFTLAFVASWPGVALAHVVVRKLAPSSSPAPVPSSAAA